MINETGYEKYVNYTWFIVLEFENFKKLNSIPHEKLEIPNTLNFYLIFYAWNMQIYF